MAQWTPQFGTQRPLSANDIGRQAAPMMQPTLGSPGFRSQFMTTTQPERPFADVGKMSINLGRPADSFGADAKATKGFVAGIGAGAGRLIGGFFDKPGTSGWADTGGSVGEAIGGVGQVPVDLAANAAGMLPSIPGLPGGSFGAALLTGSEADRQKAMAGWDGNPLSLIKHLQEADNQAWLKRTERGGDVSPLLRDIGPQGSLGDQFMATLSLLGVGSKLVERTATNIGGGQGSIDRIMQAPESELNPEILSLREDFKNGVIGKDRFLDELTMANAGYSNNWAVNMVMEMVADPVLLLGGVTGGVSKAAIGARMMKAEKFVGVLTKQLGKDAWTELAGKVEARLAAEGSGAAVTNEMILEEAQKMGAHGDVIAEAERQMSARQRWLVDYATPMEPIFKVAQAINDPISMIGRRGSKPMANAWLTAQSVEATANSFGIGNFRHVQGALEKLGKKDAFDRAMGYFTSQEGMFMQGDMIADDVMNTRRVSTATPSQVAHAQLRAGGQNYARQLESWIGRRKVDLTQATGLGTRKMREEAARETVTTKLSRMADISMDEARGIVKGLDADGLSMLDAAYFGHRIHLYNQSARAAREVLSAQVEAGGRGAAKAQKQLAQLDRATLIGPRELTANRAETLRRTLAGAASPADKATAARNAIREYDLLGSQLIADGPTDAEVITDVTQWLDDWEETLTAEMSPSQRALLPQEMRDSLDGTDGYLYGMKPDVGEAQWRIKTDPETGAYKSSRPWMDIVGDAAQPWNTRFANTNKVGTMLNALDRAVGFMSHNITTERIMNESRRDFIAKGMDGYMPSQTTALTYEQASELWTGVLNRARDLGTAPRGMGIKEFGEVLDKVPAARAAGISERDLMGMTLHSFEGRLSTVGVTQKFTGMAKTIGAEVPILPNNLLGQMAERMYPMVRFAYNPFFQLQEWVEPWVFAAARGKQARLTGGWIDPVTLEHVTPTDVMRQQDYLISRYKASNPYAEFDMMERSLVYLHGQKAAKDGAKVITGGRIERARQMAMSAGTTHDRKAIAQSEMFRHFLGPILKDQLNSINPRAWAELEMEFGTRDQGTIALRWLMEKDVWAATDPVVAHYATEAVKSRVIGASSKVDLDATAKHTFKTTRPALTMSVKDGTMTLDDFAGQMRVIGADEEFISKSWKALQFEAKEGGLDGFWEQGVKSKTNPLGRPRREIEMARSIAQSMAESKGVSEVELLSSMLDGHFLTIHQADLLASRELDFANWDFLFQQAKFSESNWFTTDPVTGAVSHAPLDPAEAEARFLAASQNPPSKLPASEHGLYHDMRPVQFGEKGRSLYIPGGIEALQDLETPFTSWEAHIIRNQLVDPNELLDPGLKHALYEKMWRGHIIEMDKPENAFKVYNNTVMAMLSAGLNLTRNELVSTRLRVNSIEELHALADDVAALRDTIQQTLPEGAEVSANDLGLAYSTREDVANFIPLDAVDSYGKTSYRPETGESIRSRASMAAGYLSGDPTKGIKAANRGLHAQTMRAAAQRDAAERATTAAEKAVADAEKALAAVDVGDVEKVAKAEARLAEKQLARDSIDPEQALRDLEEADDLAIETNDEVAIAAAERRAEKAVGRISEWAVDQAVEHITDKGIIGLRDLPTQFKPSLALITKDTAEHARYIEAAARLLEDPTDLASRDVIRELVPGAKQVDDAIIWKPWNINGAGDPYVRNLDGKVVTHGDHDIFAYIKNDDVKWRGFSTNGNIGNALKLAEDMRTNPQHFVRRRGAQYAPARPGSVVDENGVLHLDSSGPMAPNPVDVPVDHAPDEVPLHYERLGKPGIEYSADNVNERDVLVIYRDDLGRPMGYVRLDSGNKDIPMRWNETDKQPITPGKVRGAVHVFVKPEARRKGVATQLYDWVEKQGWDISETSGIDVTAQGRAFTEARAQAKADPYLEPLDEFAERLSHRSRGLSLKTGYFGIDLGNPMEFNRGVMDTHMVGDLTEWLYYDVTNKGKDPRWGEFMASLSPGKRKQIEGWLERDWVEVRVKDPVTGKLSSEKVRTPYPERAPRGAGTYDWSEATGKGLSLKGPKGATVPDSVTERAAHVRQRITDSKALTRGEKDRLFRMYRNDAELAELYGRDVKVLGGDYAIYDDLMAERKAVEELADPNIARYGHGGYQWKLWDDRRKVYDPETSAFSGAHGIERSSTRFLAASDDMHFATGFMDKGGLRPVSDAGYRYLDPGPTIMTQEQGGLLRGATISMNGTDRIIAITEHANSSTVVHELAHALLEPLLDPSGKQVVLDDINLARRLGNEKVTASLDEAQSAVAELDAAVRDSHAAMQNAEITVKATTKDVAPKMAAARKAEAQADTLKTAAAEQRGKVKTLSSEVVAKRKAIESQKMAPSVRARRLASVDAELARETKKLDTLVAQQLEAERTAPGLWDEANAAQEAADAAARDLKTATGEWKARVGEYQAKRTEYEGLATTPPQAEKMVWDEDVSEHFAEQYEVWLRTGKASNPKMRDAMAYFHRVLQRLETWLKGNPQVKVSPAMQDLFDKMHAPDIEARITQSNPVPFDATQEAFHNAGRQSVIDAEDAAFTNVQFRRGRSWAERSLNHPYFGLYPFSYMWGKVAPEMIRALATNPFGLPIPGMLAGSTPGLGFVNAQRAWNAVEMQKDTDPEFRDFMNDPQNSKMFSAAAMFMPATPWDAPANFPLWSRRLAEWGLESNQRTEEGRQTKGFDLFKTASDVTSYAFGPAATLDWMSDIARIPQAPAITQFTEGSESSGSGLEGMGANDLVVGPKGSVPLSEVLQQSAGQLQSQLKQ